MAREFWDQYQEEREQTTAMEMLLGATWANGIFGMPGYYHRIVKRQEGIMVYSHEEFYDKDGNPIENPWNAYKTRQLRG